MSEPRPSSLHIGMGWFPDQAGGLNRYLRTLLDALADAGAEARAVVLGPAEDVPARVAVAGRRDAPLPLRLVPLARAAHATGAHADVVDAHFALTALPVVLGPLRQKPLVVHFQGPWADEGRAEGAHAIVVATKRRIERTVYRRARRIVVLSEAFGRLVVERYGVSPSVVEVVPPSVDLERFAPGDRAAARAALGVPADAFVAVAVRRLVPRMGLDVLLDAWERIAAERPGALLVLAGEGGLRRELERRAARGASVHVLGRVPDAVLPVLYRAADVSVVPSVALEGFGLVVLESLACGTPAVVTDVGGLPESVLGLDASLVVPAGDADALARRLLGPLPAAAECRRHAERFSTQALAARHLAIYRKAARRRVVFVDHTAVLSGGELALLRVLPELDVDAHVILAQDGPFAARLRDAGISVEILPLDERTRDLPRERVGIARLPLQTLRTLRYAVRLARRLRELDADLVHTNSLKSALYGGVAARLARVPAVWHVRDRIAPDYLPRGAVTLVRAAARVLPKAIIANSHETLGTLPRRRASFVVPSPVEPSDVHRNGANGVLRVGMVGRIAPWKGQHVFLEAFARAFGGGDELARVIGAPLFGADEEEYARDLRVLAHSLGLAGRVQFTGFREDVAGELAHLDVLVHASVVPEPFGQVVVEGMAAGLPVVAAAAGGPAEVIEPETTGLLYPPGDTEALSESLRRLARDAVLRKRLGDAARERARAFAPATVARQLDEIFRSVR